MAEGGIDEDSVPFLAAKAELDSIVEEEMEEKDGIPLPMKEMTQGDHSPVDDTSTKEVSIVLVGKSGAGKSTLGRNILDFKKELELCASHITKECQTQQATMNGVTMKVTDTVGLEDRKQRKKSLRELCRHTQGKADLVIYCLPVNPASKFNDGNPAIMRSLQNAYGKDVWKQCLLVFTFSNITIERLRKNIRDENEVIAKYKNFLVEHATKFREELRSLNVNDVNVREVFGFQTEASIDDEPTIVALPAGDEPFDQVFPDFKDPTRFTIPLSSLLEESTQIDITDWREIIFIEIIRKCSNAELKKKLLQYRYGRDIAMSLAKAFGGVTGGATSGIAGGAAIGAGVGAIVGLVGGPVGVVPGATIGATIGAAVGVLGGGVGGGAATQVQKIRKTKHK